MAIFSTSGTQTGNQRLGTITVKLAGLGAQNHNPLDASVGDSKSRGSFDGSLLIDISTLSGLYDNRFDDYQFYT